MPRASYEYMIDLNHDGFFARGVGASDNLNLVRGAINGGLHWRSVNNATISHLVYTPLNRSHYLVTVVSGTTASAGVDFFQDGIQQYFYAENGVTYNASAIVQGTVGEEITIRLGTGTAVATVMTGSDQTLTCSFVGAGAYVNLRLTRTTTTNNVTFYVRNVMVTRGSLPTNFNSGAGSDQYEDVTLLVRDAQWTNGLSKPYEVVAQAAELTLLLDNVDGYFNNEQVGAQLLANNSFTAWSGGLPTSYTILSGGFGISVEEVGSGELSGGTGTGAFNISSAGGIIFYSLTQTILTVGTRYKVKLFISAQESGDIQFKCGAAFISQRYTTPGIYEFAFTAAATTFTIWIDAATANITLDYVTVQEVARYYGVTKGMLVAIWIDSVQMWVGRIREIRQNWGALIDETVTIICEDSGNALLKSDLKPTFSLQQSVSNALYNVFENTRFCFPYESSFWILGVDGSSELSENTVLAEPKNYLSPALALGNEVIYSDKVSNNQSGVSARAYLEDVMQSTMGGRLYWNGRVSYFEALDRNYDNENTTDTYSLTDDDYEMPEYVYGDDLVNEVTVRYSGREQESETKILWSVLESFTVQPSETKRLNAEFRDPDQVEVKVYAYELLPMDGSDYSFTPTINADKVFIERKDHSQSCTFSITNTRQQPITFTALRVRGKIIRAAQEESVTVENVQSIRNTDRYPRTYNLPLITSGEDAFLYATALVQQFGNPYGRYNSISFIANKTAARIARISGGALNSRIQIDDAHVGHSGAYIIVGERHHMQAGGEDTHTVTWILKPVDRILYWILGTTGRSELGETTYLAF